MLQTTTKTNVGRDRSHVNYDGINVYGDETTNIKRSCCRFVKCRRYQSVTICCFNSIPPNYNVSRTGYKKLILRITKRVTPRSIFSSLQAICNDVEVIWQSKFGFVVFIKEQTGII
jgi:hypothetical protein